MISLALTAVLVSPTPSPTPLRIIEHLRTSAACTLLHQEVAPSVGGMLRNDIIIQQAGTSVGRMVQSINGLGGDSPYGNPGVALAQVQLLSLGSRLVRNLEDINRALSDPRFAYISDDPRVAAIRQSLRRVAEQQSALLNIIFSIAYSSHPADLRYYPDPVQTQIRDAIRREPRRTVVSGDVFGPFATIANEDISRTRSLENVAASQIITVARGCGDTAIAPSAVQANHVPRRVSRGAPSSTIPAADRVTYAAAKAFYADLVSGTVARSRLSPYLDVVLTPSFLETISAQLTALGTPTWEYLGRATISGGLASVYKLSYPDGVALYYGYGAGAGGAVYLIYIGTQRPSDV